MEQKHDVDIRTRANLAYLWSIALIVFVGYILFQYGHILAILTLVIGFITGTSATVLAVYFGSTIGQKKPDDPTNQLNAENINVNAPNP